MKKQIKSFFDRKNLNVLTKKDTKRIKGGTSSADSSPIQDGGTGIVIEDIIQI